MQASIFDPFIGLQSDIFPARIHVYLIGILYCALISMSEPVRESTAQAPHIHASGLPSREHLRSYR